MLFNFRAFQYFRTIAQERNISKAAQKLYISQSTLSKFLTQLEAELGTRLLDRSQMPLALTAAGERFLQYIGDAARLHDHYMRRIAQADNSEMRQLHIGVGPWTGSFIISHVFEPFRQLHPNIELRLYEENDDNIHRMLAQKQLDVAVVVHTEVDRSHPSAAWFETLITQHRLLVVSKEHFLAGLVTADDLNSPQNPKYIDLRMLSNQNMILGKAGQRINNDMRDVFAKYDISPSGVIETQNIDSMIALAANNLGIAIIPTFYLSNCAFLDKLVFFYSDDPCMQWLLTAEYKTVDPPDPVRQFVQMIKETYQKEAEHS
ncbi:LysR family transcriptional regulator [Oscillospiraceae bacterium LTW-04]|nr:LysR family transcriptional regulator [Oscillospiraceae bacterium MB24-C1]